MNNDPLVSLEAGEENELMDIILERAASFEGSKPRLSRRLTNRSYDVTLSPQQIGTMTLDQVSLLVCNLKANSKFYTEVMGFAPIHNATGKPRIRILASAGDMKSVSLRHSLRKLPLKLSMKTFCRGFPRRCSASRSAGPGTSAQWPCGLRAATKQTQDLQGTPGADLGELMEMSLWR